MNNLLKTSPSAMHYLINSKIAIHTKTLRDLRVTTSALLNKVNMNNAKLNVCKKVLQELCEKFNRVEEFIKDKIEEIFCNENSSVEDVT